MNNVEIVSIYDEKKRFVHFNYYGKVLDSPIELHAPRWSIKDVGLEDTIIEKLKKAKAFTLNNLRKKKDKYSFEIIGKRDKNIKDVISEMEIIYKPLANILRNTIPYRIEIRTSNSVVDTKRGYIDFHLYPYEWLQEELTLRLHRFSKNKKFLEILINPLTLKIFAHIIKDDSVYLKQFDEDYGAKYQKVRRIINRLVQIRILRKVGKSPALYEFCTDEIKMDILSLLLTVNRILYHIR